MHHKLLLALVSFVLFISSAHSQSARSDSTTLPAKLKTLKTIQSQVFRATLTLDKGRAKTAVYLDACGNEGIADALRKSKQVDQDELIKTSGVLALPEVMNGAVTPTEVASAAAMADEMFVAYLFGVHEVARTLVSTKEREAFCSAALKVANRFLKAD